MKKITFKRKITMFCVLITVVLFTITASLIRASADTQAYYMLDEGEYKQQTDTEVICIVTPLP